MEIKFFMRDHLDDLVEYIDKHEKDRVYTHIINKSYIQECYMNPDIMKKITTNLKIRHNELNRSSEFTFLKEFARLNGSIILYPDPEPLTYPTDWETIPAILQVEYVEENNSIIIMGSNSHYDPESKSGVVVTEDSIDNMLPQIYDNIYLKLDSGNLYEQEQRNSNVFQLQLFYTCLTILALDSSDARYDNVVMYEGNRNIKFTYKTKHIAKAETC